MLMLSFTMLRDDLSLAQNAYVSLFQESARWPQRCLYVSVCVRVCTHETLLHHMPKQGSVRFALYIHMHALHCEHQLEVATPLL